MSEQTSVTPEDIESIAQTVIQRRTLDGDQAASRDLVLEVANELITAGMEPADAFHKAKIKVRNELIFGHDPEVEYARLEAERRIEDALMDAIKEIGPDAPEAADQ